MELRTYIYEIYRIISFTSTWQKNMQNVEIQLFCLMKKDKKKFKFFALAWVCLPKEKMRKRKNKFSVYDDAGILTKVMDRTVTCWVSFRKFACFFLVWKVIVKAKLNQNHNWKRSRERERESRRKSHEKIANIWSRKKTHQKPTSRF